MPAKNIKGRNIDLMIPPRSYTIKNISNIKFIKAIAVIFNPVNGINLSCLETQVSYSDTMGFLFIW